ncbi:hypothetical protein ACP70R_034858 [Stipagrostis hirtigluma subsp. patula]
MPSATIEEPEPAAAPDVHRGDGRKVYEWSTDKPWVDDPWNPPCPPCPCLSGVKSKHTHVLPAGESLFAHLDTYEKTIRRPILAEARSTRIIAPERNLHDVMFNLPSKGRRRLNAALRKDSVRRFLRMFKCEKHIMTSEYIVAPQMFSIIIKANALRCARAVLKGTAPELDGHRANPNAMIGRGCFPLHRAAEAFSADMVTLLLRHGASANLLSHQGENSWTTGDLLPLHVAVGNTCNHKYIEDNLKDQKWDGQEGVRSIYKLIHLLCLPEMKICLDTVRVLARHTDDMIDELWNCINNRELDCAAILLVAAQKQIGNKVSCRGNDGRTMNGFDIIKDRIMEQIGNGVSCRRDDGRTMNGFDIIMARIRDFMVSLEMEGLGLTSGKNREAQREMEEKRIILRNALVLVDVISKAGEALDAYIQTHSKASHQEVFGSVSSILRDHGFAPCGEGVNIGDLKCCPCDSEVPNSKMHGEDGGTEKATVSPKPDIKAIRSRPKENNAAGAERTGRQKLQYLRDMFIPHENSILEARSMTVNLNYSEEEAIRSIQKLYMEIGNQLGKPKAGGSSRPRLLRSKDSFGSLSLAELHARNQARKEAAWPDRFLQGLIQKNPNYQPRRLFGAMTRTLLKMLKIVRK